MAGDLKLVTRRVEMKIDCQLFPMIGSGVHISEVRSNLILNADYTEIDLQGSLATSLLNAVAQQFKSKIVSLCQDGLKASFEQAVDEHLATCLDQALKNHDEVRGEIYRQVDRPRGSPAATYKIRFAQNPALDSSLELSVPA